MATSGSIVSLPSADSGQTQVASVSETGAGAPSETASTSLATSHTPNPATTEADNDIVTASGTASEPKQRYHIQPGGAPYEVYGVDAIWHNQYRGPNSNFEGMRGQYECDINAVLLMVAKHVEQGLYSIISLNATPNFLSVIMGCEKNREDMPEDMFNCP